MTEHTRRWYRIGYDIREKSIDAGNNERDRHICTLDSGSRNADELQADGDLIIAALELLAACKSPGTKETFGIPGDDKTWPELLRTLADGLDALPPDAAPHSWYLWRALLRHKADEIAAAIKLAEPEGK